MKLLIFENEWVEIEEAFECLSLEFFDDQLSWKVLVSSEEMGDIENVLDYDVILVDLDLSKKSPKDGYAVANDILQLESHPPVVIITGAFETVVRKRLEEKNLPKLPIIKKPVDVDDIYAKLIDAVG